MRWVNTLMNDILIDENLGTTKTWYGRTINVTAKRGEIPKNILEQSTRGNDGRLYFVDEKKNAWPILLPGTDEYREAERSVAILSIPGNEGWFIPSSESLDNDEDEDESFFPEESARLDSFD